MARTRDLTGAIVAVVGATGGLGTPIVETLRSRGATVIRAGRSDGVDVTVDLRDSRSGADLATFAVEQHGRLDGVVVAAGIVAFGDLSGTDDVVVEELFLTNSMGPIWLAARVEAALADSAGFFVNVSGVVAETPMPGMVAYSASKAAAAAAMTAVAKEWRRKKITVTDVRPPHTETGLATRPLAGTAPEMPDGLAPAAVAERIVAAIEGGEREVAGSDF
ncbi:MAG: SDR family NAD(P)-dependent oxidoreductase [Ilumatobacter sp.]|uniref:SDR family NAD(P)-dependent oxidoreductase n=1 Tax=Ilumatobacter sp. TaxID=1967498 RepID=UPI003C715340